MFKRQAGRGVGRGLPQLRPEAPRDVGAFEPVRRDRQGAGARPGGHRRDRVPLLRHARGRSPEHRDGQPLLARVAEPGEHPPVRRQRRHPGLRPGPVVDDPLRRVAPRRPAPHRLQPLLGPLPRPGDGRALRRQPDGDPLYPLFSFRFRGDEHDGRLWPGRRHGVLANPVDAQRVRRLVDAARGARR